MDGLPFLDPNHPLEDRVKDLVARLTLEEKISQLKNAAPAIPRLGVPEYDWWTECLHGVARAGTATVFPQSIGLASAWDPGLIFRVADAISTEARAKHHEFARRGIRSMNTGLTCWSPNINIFRDPRWGRGQETYGEDPYLTAQLGVAFVRGLQGDHPYYLKTVATPKHLAVHSGPENERHSFDAQASERDLRETYLPAFQACVQEGEAGSVMGAYSRANGEPCCASPVLLDEILRSEWGFGKASHGVGFVVSDCGAIRDIWKYHRVVQTPAEAAALAVHAGCDLECGDTYSALKEALAKGLITEEAINRSVERLFTARFRLGMFDPPEQVPYAQIPYELVDCTAHQELALEAARASLVLLKNDGLLPLASLPKTIAVIGPNADQPQALLGNYNGTPSHTVTPLEGLRLRVRGQAQVSYAPGCELQGSSTAGISEAVTLAAASDLAVVVLGLSQEIEGEEGQSEGVPGGRRSRGDRESLDLPGVQEELLRAVAAAGTPVILALVNGSALAIQWAAQHIPAILELWYPGQAGGTVLAEALFGDLNPAGRLPVTFYQSADQLPPFRDYRMQGRTYRFFRGEPLYPFGYGLSYTTFEYSDLQILPPEGRAGEKLTIQATVRNTGSRAGDEVVQLYLGSGQHSDQDPLWELNGFDRITLAPGEARRVTFVLPPPLAAFERRLAAPGDYHLAIGGCSPGPKFSGLMANFQVI